MGASKTLVVFYLRSGTTRRIALALSEALKCDLEEITEPKPPDWSSRLHAVASGGDAEASFHNHTETARRPLVRPGCRRHSSLGLVVKLPGSGVPNVDREPTARGRILLYPRRQAVVKAPLRR